MNWPTRLLRRQRLEAQLDAELRDHFEGSAARASQRMTADDVERRRG